MPVFVWEEEERVLLVTLPGEGMGVWGAFLFHKWNCLGVTFIILFLESGTSACIFQVALPGCALATGRVCIPPQWASVLDFYK